ncbi:hypothetical protein MTX26_09275 [Bradyrhizobium sp. ISRA443]|uniref:hypothetical protein n=1 Tax=unclassified Bradyrhizobium TaxID=2631580 RepID=UPI002478EC0B|nr:MULTISPECIES: hypothetical protein [unclassified Bradyrhizobium]WGR95857.1 hypothetical protein MTX20_19580 [Bradyrhizobium sp. ISRA435]WGS00990.1 hypothetical protein MTX23_09270 [Bradyrhizobium sp. ISRA436]WGS07877.1 hypothetical protein MTX18_09275 [Bradyrhizobium sp. ISRA437]WGS14765.1 hypothetical protein MTX26_09275 [Bradyrhizobium sp. ISRA443]
MPAFTFEKITPPVHSGPVAPVEQKQRGVIVQILDRIVEACVRRTLKQDKAETIARRDSAPSE